MEGGKKDRQILKGIRQFIFMTSNYVVKSFKLLYDGKKRQTNFKKGIRQIIFMINNNVV